MMFYFSRRRRPLYGLGFLMSLLGFGWLVSFRWSRLTDEEREEKRKKARLFRKKMREAYDVWLEDSPVSESNQTTQDS